MGSKKRNKAERERQKMLNDVNKSSKTRFSTGVNTRYFCSVCKRWLTFGNFYDSPPDKLVCSRCISHGLHVEAKPPTVVFVERPK